MGARNPDRIASPPSPLAALTLAEIYVAGWELRARCNRCRTELRADVRSMIRVFGPDAIWWGRKPTCPGWACSGGELTYAARAIPSGSWVMMTTAPSQQIIDLWKSKRRVSDRGPRNT